MGGEKPVSMEIETETVQPTQRVDNDYQEQENRDNRHVTERDDNETRNMQLITQSAPNTDQETTTSREEGPVQQEAQVRSGTTPTTTSDDDISTPKPLTETKRMKKQKVTKETGLVRDNRRSTDRQRKTQRL
jgi:hypothetical protein